VTAAPHLLRSERGVATAWICISVGFPKTISVSQGGGRGDIRLHTAAMRRQAMRRRQD
jgi:hypothetical protein